MKQASAVERTQIATEAATAVAPAKRGQLLQRPSAARIPRAAATNSPAQGARWRNQINGANTDNHNIEYICYLNFFNTFHNLHRIGVQTTVCSSVLVDTFSAFSR